jgi:hypothetical protein
MTLSAGAVGASNKPAAVTWKPTDLGSQLHAWYDADDAATITTATGVSAWADKSTNARSAAQPNTSYRPTRATNAQNSRAVLQFDGTNDHLIGGYNLTGEASFSIHFAAWPASAARFQCIVRQQGPGVGYVIVPYAFDFPTNPVVILSFDGATTSVNESGVTTTGGVVFGFVRVSGSSNKAFKNGTENSTRTANTSSLATGATAAIGANANAITNDPYRGDLGDLIITTGTLSSTDREKIEGYLAHKWGLTGNLPSGHPYKTTAP